MKVSILISLAFLSSLLLGCASTQTKSLLEERAGYGVTPPAVNLAGAGSAKYVPTRVPETVIVPWLHGKDLSPTEYFWGSWLSVVVVPETWQMKAVEVPKATKSGVKRTPSRPPAKPKMGAKSYGRMSQLETYGLKMASKRIQLT